MTGLKVSIGCPTEWILNYGMQLSQTVAIMGFYHWKIILIFKVQTIILQTKAGGR